MVVIYEVITIYPENKEKPVELATPPMSRGSQLRLPNGQTRRSLDAKNRFGIHDPTEGERL